MYDISANSKHFFCLYWRKNPSLSQSLSGEQKETFSITWNNHWVGTIRIEENSIKVDIVNNVACKYIFLWFLCFKPFNKRKIADTYCMHATRSIDDKIIWFTIPTDKTDLINKHAAGLFLDDAKAVAGHVQRGRHGLLLRLSVTDVSRATQVTLVLLGHKKINANYL